MIEILLFTLNVQLFFLIITIKKKSILLCHRYSKNINCNQEEQEKKEEQTQQEHFKILKRKEYIKHEDETIKQLDKEIDDLRI